MLCGDLDEGLVFRQMQLDRESGLGSDVEGVRARVPGRFIAIEGQCLDQTLGRDAVLGYIHKLLRWRWEMTERLPYLSLHMAWAHRPGVAVPVNRQWSCR